ncbi:hypothetical protein AAF712_013650 [Marasmius tenuissimus]|uniref:AAA-ATPase-like domain-containing protein n=1 Tax=Marasmius tenuissimus TaxID=585030 RepID=A0ABR2ZEE8_9AGAR
MYRGSRLAVTPRETDVKREDCYGIIKHGDPALKQGVSSLAEQLQERLAQIACFRHYFDRSRIVDVLSRHRIVLLHSPPGCGKTSTLSMIGQLYDVLRKEELVDAFRATSIGSRACGRALNRNNQLVLSLDLESVTPDNLNQVLNVQLEVFASKYRRFLDPEDTWSFICDEVSGTVDNIMTAVMDAGRSVVVTVDNHDSPFIPDMPRSTYDKLTSDLVAFLRLFQLWTECDVVSAMLIAGEYMLKWQLGCHDLAYDVVAATVLDHHDDLGETKLCGITPEEIRCLSLDLSRQFPSLQLEGLADEFLETVGKEMWTGLAEYYGYSFREVFDWFHDRLKEGAVQIREDQPISYRASASSQSHACMSIGGPVRP